MPRSALVLQPSTNVKSSVPAGQVLALSAEAWSAKVTAISVSEEQVTELTAAMFSSSIPFFPSASVAISVFVDVPGLASA